MKSNEELAQEVLQALRNCRVDGSLIRLPDPKVDTLIFDQLKNLFTGQGGKYKKAKDAFYFDEKDEDATTNILLEVIKTYEEQPVPADDQPGTDESLPFMQDEPEAPAPPAPPKPTRTQKTLKYVFTKDEAHQLALDLSAEIRKLQELEEQKGSVVAQYGAKIKEAKARINRISGLVGDGHEHRDVEVEIAFHIPEPGKKTMTRKDTGESWVEDMDKYEFNLFNQPPPADGGGGYAELGL